MRGLRRAAALLPAVLALLLLAAHFFRAGQVAGTVLCLALIGLCVVRARWSARVLQGVLVLGALEWLRTAWVFAAARAEAGQSYGRLLLILGTVALVTAGAALALRTRPARAHFRCDD